MTCETTPTEAAGTPATDPGLPPAPRSWPHIARRRRSSPPADHPTHPLPAWPQRTTEKQPRDIHRGRGAGRCTGRGRGAATVPVDESGAVGDREPGRIGGRHRASPPAGFGDRSEPGAHPVAGPSDLARRARRYERRMTHRSAGAPEKRHTDTGSPQAERGRGSQRATPIRTTRFPVIHPRSTPLPGQAPARHAPDRHLRRSPGRNPVRGPGVEGCHLSISGTPRRRPGRRGPGRRRRGPESLIGAALTTAFLAFPLGPAPTAAAVPADSALLARASAGGRTTTATRPLNTYPAAPPPTTAWENEAPLAARTPAPDSTATAPVGTGVPVSPADSSTATPADAVSGPPGVGAPMPAEPDSGPSNEVARRSPAGSSRAGGCGTGSSSGSATGSGAICRILPLLEDLVGELVRPAPRPVPPRCPCPDRGR